REGIRECRVGREKSVRGYRHLRLLIEAGLIDAGAADTIEEHARARADDVFSVLPRKAQPRAEIVGAGFVETAIVGAGERQPSHRLELARGKFGDRTPG